MYYPGMLGYVLPWYTPPCTSLGTPRTPPCHTGHRWSTAVTPEQALERRVVELTVRHGPLTVLPKSVLPTPVSLLASSPHTLGYTRLNLTFLTETCRMCPSLHHPFHCWMRSLPSSVTQFPRGFTEGWESSCRSCTFLTFRPFLDFLPLSAPFRGPLSGGLPL